MSDMTVREMLYKNQRLFLSNRAAFDSETKGREYPVSPCSDRGEYQRDRDRILHSKAFRRLSHKTQVFLSPEADHYRTRLTHTLKVAQVARTIARSLRLNEDLTEAIALGHDLGHTPFGHAGERALRRVYDSEFAHYKQSLRVVDKLEELNLTWEVRDGILHHTLGGASTLEGQIVKEADRIAYINHDIDDAIRAEILVEEDIPAEIRKTLGNDYSARIKTMVGGVISASAEGDKIKIDAEISAAIDELYDFLNIAVYHNPIAKGQEDKAEKMLEKLYYYFYEHSDELPSEYRKIARIESVGRASADYISGMTDRYAIRTFRTLFIPEVWSGS
jgi:dGTPase